MTVYSSQRHAIVAVALSLTAVALGGWARQVDGPFPGDLTLTLWTQDVVAGATLEEAAESLYDLRLIVLAGAFLTALRFQRYALAWSALVLVLGIVLNPLFKDLVDRARPGLPEVSVRERAAGEGFPSGHASSATLSFGYAAVVAWYTAARAWLQFAVGAASVGAILLVGWERVYEGVHWPSDVAGGMVVGAAFLAITVVLTRVWESSMLRGPAT